MLTQVNFHGSKIYKINADIKGKKYRGFYRKKLTSNARLKLLLVSSYFGTKFHI